MSTETIFINQTRAELKTIAGIRYRSIAALWIRALVRVHSILEVRGGVHVR